MSIKLFQTVLDLQTKTGALAFYQKPTPGFPQGRILEAAFSRPDIGATSGATVFRDGQLIELGENDPDWDDANGCPRILMRPQVENLKSRSHDFNFRSGLDSNITSSVLSSSGIIEKSKPLQVREVASNTQHSFQIQPDATLVVGQTYTRFVVLDYTENRYNITVSDAGQTSSSFHYNFETNTVFSTSANVVSYSVIRYDQFAFVYITFTATGPIGRLSINLLNESNQISYLGDVNEGVTIHYVGYFLGEYRGLPVLTDGSALTRSANSINWSNMQASGVLGSDTGAWLIKLKDYQSWANVSTFLRLDGDGSDTLRLSARTNNQLLLLFDAGLGTNSLGAAFNGADAVISVTYDTTWLRLFVGASKHAEIEHGGSLSLDNLRTNIASAFAEIALMAFTPVFLSDSQMIAANAEAQNL